MQHERLSLVARRNRRHLKVDFVLAVALVLGFGAGAMMVSSSVGLLRPQATSAEPDRQVPPNFPTDLVQLARLEG